MTQTQYEQSVTDAIRARIAAEPVLLPCICGAEDMDVEVNHWTGATLIHCHDCDRSVGALNRKDAAQMWGRCMGAI